MTRGGGLAGGTAGGCLPFSAVTGSVLKLFLEVVLSWKFDCLCVDALPVAVNITIFFCDCFYAIVAVTNHL